MLGIGFSPDITYRTLRSTDEPYSSLYISERDDIERPRWGYSTGLYANYIFNGRFGIGTGLVYTIKGYEVTKHWVDLSDRRTFLYPESHFIQGLYTFQYFDVPLTAMFTFGKSRLRSITQIGVIGSLLWAADYTYTSEYEDGRTDSWRSPVAQTLTVMDIGGYISTGIAYRMNENFDLRLEPNFRHAFASSRNSSYATDLFWNAGINASAFLDLQ